MEELMYKLPHDDINQKHISLQRSQTKDNKYTTNNCHLGTVACAIFLLYDRPNCNNSHST